MEVEVLRWMLRLKCVRVIEDNGVKYWWREKKDRTEIVEIE